MHDPREESFCERKERTAEPAVRRSQRVLTEEGLAARRAEEAENAVLEVSPVAAVPVGPSAAVDPDASLRHARIGIVAVAALIMLLVWIMQRRKGG